MKRLIAVDKFIIRMDDNLKQQFDRLCTELGLNMSTAFNIFARTMVRQQRIPFENDILTLSLTRTETHSDLF